MKSITKTIKLSIAMASVLLPLSQNVNAATFRYKFKVASSGLDIYACNAGVLSQDTQLVCIDKKNGKKYIGAHAKTLAESCATAKGNCQSNIICNQKLGSTFVNGLVGQVMSYDAYSPSNPQSGFQSKTAVAQSVNKWSTLVSEKDAKNTFLGDLSFMFMTEMYNAKYFVDICIRAPLNALQSNISNSFNIEQRASDVPLVYTKKAIPGQNDRTGVVVDESLSNYIKKAGVKVEGYIACDKGSSSADINASNVEFTIGADGITPVSAGGKYFLPSGASTQMNGSEILIKSTDIENPSFCKVRYVFTESSSTEFRTNKLEGAEMCTFTTFNDPLTGQASSVVESQNP